MKFLSYYFYKIIKWTIKRPFVFFYSSLITLSLQENYFLHTPRKKTAISLAIVELLKKLQSDLRIIKIFLVYF